MENCKLVATSADDGGIEDNEYVERSVIYLIQRSFEKLYVLLCMH